MSALVPRGLGELSSEDIGRTIRIAGGPRRIVGSVRHYLGGVDKEPRTSVIHRHPAAKPTDPWTETARSSDTPIEIA